MKLPFLFNVAKPGEGGHYVVVIATHDYVFADTDWMCDEQLPANEYQSTFQPSVDEILEHHKFDTELEAVAFIRDWWVCNPVLPVTVEG